MNAFVKSPMNYIGNKYRIIGQIKKWFPKQIDTMVDLFCGGCDVSFNTDAKYHIANDINHHVIEIFMAFKELGCESTLLRIDSIINQWGLSKTDKDAYEAFRAYYNTTRDPVDLYVLMCFSFNYQFRFNAKHEFNNPFGKNRSSFNDTMRSNLIQVFPSIEKIEYQSKDFMEMDLSGLREGDFVYADPPYLLTCGSYNDGKRGFKGWSAKDDKDLFSLLDGLSERGIKFALSNVSEHKGMINSELIYWKKHNRYHMHNIDFNYNNCNYQALNKNNVTKEVLITNY